MEIADFVHIADDDEVTLIHIKAAKSPAAGRQISVSSYEVVVGQAIKNVRHLQRQTLADVLRKGRNKLIGGAVWHNGVRQPDRTGLIARAKGLPHAYPKKVVVLQPQLTEGERTYCIGPRATAGRAMRMKQLDTLMLTFDHPLAVAARMGKRGHVFRGRIPIAPNPLTSNGIAHTEIDPGVERDRETLSIRGVRRQDRLDELTVSGFDDLYAAIRVVEADPIAEPVHYQVGEVLHQGVEHSALAVRSEFLKSRHETFWRAFTKPIAIDQTAPSGKIIRLGAVVFLSHHRGVPFDVSRPLRAAVSQGCRLPSTGQRPFGESYGDDPIPGPTLTPPPMSHRNYLSLHRKRWALSQRELALLLGQASRSVISRLELGHGRPSLPFVIRCESVFGVRATELFPDLFEENHDVVMRQAVHLDLQVRGRTDAGSARKRALLLEMVGRTPNPDIV